MKHSCVMLSSIANSQTHPRATTPPGESAQGGKTLGYHHNEICLERPQTSKHCTRISDTRTLLCSCDFPPTRQGSNIRNFSIQPSIHSPSSTNQSPCLLLQDTAFSIETLPSPSELFLNNARTNIVHFCLLLIHHRPSGQCDSIATCLNKQPASLSAKLSLLLANGTMRPLLSLAMERNADIVRLMIRRVNSQARPSVDTNYLHRMRQLLSLALERSGDVVRWVTK